MKNSENQKIRNKEKWLESEAKGCDQSGNMYFCTVCEFSQRCKSSPTGYRCDYGGTTGDFEVVPYPCATAYNRYKRKEYEESKKRFNENCIDKCIKIMNN